MPETTELSHPIAAPAAAAPAESAPLPAKDASVAHGTTPGAATPGDTKPIAVMTPEPPIAPSDYRTPGEKLHRFVKNRVVNTFMNMGIGFWFEWASNYGEGRGWAANQVFKVGRELDKVIERNPGLGRTFKILWLTQGGNALLPVVERMDHYKLPITMKFDEWLDKLHGRHPDEIEKARRAAAYDRIAHEYHPTWDKILAARGAGIVWNTGTDYILGKLDERFLPAPENAKPADFGYGRMGRTIVDVYQKQTGKAMSQMAEFWVRTIPLEVLSTLNTVGFFTFTYDWFDKTRNKKLAEAAKGGDGASLMGQKTKIAYESPVKDDDAALLGVPTTFSQPDAQKAPAASNFTSRVLAEKQAMEAAAGDRPAPRETLQPRQGDWRKQANEQAITRQQPGEVMV